MTPTPEPPVLTAAQLEVMHVIWERGEASVTDVWHAIREVRKVARATVQTLIQRLEDRGWLSHREVGQAFLYRAERGREATQGRIASDLVASAFGGSAAGLVKALLDERRLSDEERERIRALLDEAEAQRSGPAGPQAKRSKRSKS